MTAPNKSRLLVGYGEVPNLEFLYGSTTYVNPGERETAAVLRGERFGRGVRQPERRLYYPRSSERPYGRTLLLDVRPGERGLTGACIRIVQRKLNAGVIRKV